MGSCVLVKLHKEGGSHVRTAWDLLYLTHRHLLHGAALKKDNTIIPKVLLAMFSQNDNYGNEELHTFHLQDMLCDTTTTAPCIASSVFTFIASFGLAS